jgi:hypothetical protein
MYCLCVFQFGGACGYPVLISHAVQDTPAGLREGEDQFTCCL